MDTPDYLAFAAGLDQFREGIRSVLAGLKAEGFTEEQAHDIVAGMFRMMGKSDD